MVLFKSIEKSQLLEPIHFRVSTVVSMDTGEIKVQTTSPCLPCFNFLEYK